MSADQKTVAFYDGAAKDYAGKFGRTEPDLDLRAFMDALPAGGRVLDLGCGPGNSAAMMRAAGFEAEASDASPEMAALARENYGLEVRVEGFDALDAVARYDGVWANFSLLHAARGDMPGHLTRIHTALRPGGVLHLGLKLGKGEARDDLGRFYTYFAEEEVRGLLARAGFKVMSTRHGEAAGMTGAVEPFIIVLAHA